MSKPRLLIITSAKQKNDLALSMYQYMKRPDGAFDTTIVLDPGPGVNNSFKYLTDNYMDHDPPDHIMLGTWAEVGSFTSPLNDKYADEHNIKTSINVADVEALFDMPSTLDALARWSFDYIWCPWKDSPLLKVSERMKEFVETFAQFNKANLFFEPWSYNDKKLVNPKYARTYDVFYSMSVNRAWPWHRNRIDLFKKLLDLTKREPTLSAYGGAIDPEGGWHGMYGERYLEGIRQSKTFVVDTSMRHYMTAKYIEGGVLGSCMVGDAPLAHPDIFNEETMFPIPIDSPSFGLVMEKHLIYAKTHPQEVIAKASLMQEKIKAFRHEVVIPRIEEKLL